MTDKILVFPNPLVLFAKLPDGEDIDAVETMEYHGEEFLLAHTASDRLFSVDRFGAVQEVHRA